jgi:ubiquinone/menaquinone biosynthesis C-methylase UbiE
MLLSDLTQSIYEKHASQFDEERYKGLIEKKWLDMFCAICDENAHVLDVGCGAAEPIAKYFIDKGYSLTGVDFSSPMIELAKARYPDQSWIVQDMRYMDLGQQYDGIISWHSFFHLKKDDQRDTLRVFARHLKRGGPLMLTVGPEEGEEIGHVCGDKVYHASLSPEEYEKILKGEDISVVEFVKEDEECDLCTVILAKKDN